MKGPKDSPHDKKPSEETRHVSVPYAGIDYIKHTIAGSDVDPDTVELLS
ncbi:MAG: hypothetical protein ACLP36_07910 [Acidimicrobiales bacterium]